MIEPLAPHHEFLFTEPWEAISVRRGDALGLRLLTDRFADSLAPGLSNRTMDARWISLLSWCLVRSHEVWSKSGARDLYSRVGARERYAWLRPLELMWIARTIVIADTDWPGRQLPGQRRVNDWLAGGCRAPRFGMSSDQLRRYRQTGVYGAYRVVFRSVPGLTVNGDGWTPGADAHRLARWVSSKIAKSAQPEDIDDVSPQWARWRDREDEWWLRNWSGYLDGSAATALPKKRSDFSPLPEAPYLESMLFGDDARGQRRKRVAAILQHSHARDHLALCRDVVRGLARETDGDSLRALPAFSRLADAGMSVMENIRRLLVTDAGLGISLSDLAKHQSVQRACDKLHAAGRVWLATSRRSLSRSEVVDDLAAAASVAKLSNRVARLLRHHETHGGGLKWFGLVGGAVVPLMTVGSGDGSLYRFRLEPLGRIAVQTGRIRRMPVALKQDRSVTAESDAEYANV